MRCNGWNTYIAGSVLSKRILVSKQVDFIKYRTKEVENYVFTGHERFIICQSNKCLKSCISPSLIPVTWQPRKTAAMPARTQRPQLKWSFWTPCSSSGCADQPSLVITCRGWPSRFDARTSWVMRSIISWKKFDISLATTLKTSATHSYLMSPRRNVCKAVEKIDFP